MVLHGAHDTSWRAANGRRLAGPRRPPAKRGEGCADLVFQ
jgi:hypothetical protein